MSDGDAHFRHMFVKKLLGPAEILDARTDVKRLPAAVALAQQRLAHDHWIKRRNEGAHGEPIDRRRGDDG